MSHRVVQIYFHRLVRGLSTLRTNVLSLIILPPGAESTDKILHPPRLLERVRPRVRRWD